MRGMTCPRVNWVVNYGKRGKTREIRFRGTCCHVTLMTVVSAIVQLFKTLLVIPGVQTQYRKWSNGKHENPSDYLPITSHLQMRKMSGVDTDIFYSWARGFMIYEKHVGRGSDRLL